MASMQIEQPAASAKEDPDMNMFLSSDAGMSWMANQLAQWDASAKRSLASFGDGLRDKFEKEVKPRWAQGGRRWLGHHGCMAAR